MKPWRRASLVVFCNRPCHAGLVTEKHKLFGPLDRAYSQGKVCVELQPVAVNAGEKCGQHGLQFQFTAVGRSRVRSRVAPDGCAAAD